MNISYNWLRQYLPIDMSAREAAELLTHSGLEVEHVVPFSSVEGGLEGIVIGEVLTRDKHPDADRLSVCTVNVGRVEPLNIVCGAPNVAAGQKVVVATVGAKLYPSEGEPFEIKRSKIRGQASEGMICAEDEIGLGKSHDGIMVLPVDTKVGTPAADFFKVENDEVLEIGLTPNRADAMSHIGVARDLRAVARAAKGGLEKLELQWPDVANYSAQTENPIAIEVKDTDAAPRYVGVYIEGVKVGPSPQWLQDRLKAIGSRPINNVVDVTNFVLHELGQPLHAFDAHRIGGKKVVVRTAHSNERFTTLDEVERSMHGEDLLICDADKGMCIAGVFGGANSGVTEQTVNVFLESAYFNPVTIRKTAKRHGLSTDASFRFERGIDPEITVYAAKRAALLIQQVAGGKTSAITDIYPNPIPHHKVEVKFAHIDRLIGQAIASDTVVSILEDLGIFIEKRNAEGLRLSVPTFKTDVTREADIIEEVLRVYGYDRVEGSGQLRVPLTDSPDKDVEMLRNMVADTLTSQGFNEIMNNSLTRSAYAEKHLAAQSAQSVIILNPLSTDLNAMRQSLLFGGLESVSRNIRHQNPDVRFYEFGNLYFNAEENIWPYREQHSLGIFLSGKWQQERWNAVKGDVSFQHVYAVVRQLLERMNIQARFTDLPAENSIFAYGMAFSLKDKVLARFGSVRKDILATFDIDQEVFFADVDWDAVLAASAINRLTVSDLPKFPSVRRDLALLVDRSVKYARIEELAHQTERKLLREVDLFDIYEGKGVPEGKRSYAVSFILRDDEATLQDKSIEKTMERLVGRFKQELGAELRG
ncbi:MAG: phenylalanine--tRNA ligase subunit beta [Flavobacteriales bacterium]|nr:phenylalanine--tRNA ligase subunit beta [Flavobacteriales bacterium]